MADAAPGTSDLLAAIAAIDTSDVRPVNERPAEAPFDPFIPADDFPHPVATPYVREVAAEVDDGLGDDHTGLIDVAAFPIIGSSYSVGPKGTLRLTLIVDRAHKYDAMPVTDWPGMQLHVVVFRPPLPDELDPDDDE